MQSKTSFFNKTIFRKTAARFWPLWMIYVGIWCLLLPLPIISRVHYGTWSMLSAQRYVLSVTTELNIISGMLAGVGAAMAVWSFLYSARSAHGMACLPVRREGVFTSVTLAGIAPLLACDVLLFLLSLGAEALGGAVHIGSLLTWLAVNVLCLLFFYGFAVFCAQLTGNLVVLPIVYMVLNFTAVVVETIVRALAAGFVYGCSNSGEIKLSFLSPCIELLNRCGRTATYNDSAQYAEVDNVVGYLFYGWRTLGIYAVVGLLLLALALLLFRRRRMESAGDVVAIRVLKPVFKYCFTFGCAIVLGWIICYTLVGIPSDGMGGIGTLLVLMACMLLGAAIGYFAAEMLIRKSFRVWRGHWGGFGISVLVIVALLFSAELDLFGYESRVPDPDKVDRVFVSVAGQTVTLEDEASIRAIADIHASIVENKDVYENYGSIYSGDLKSTYLRLEYVKGSSITNRRYTLYYQDNKPETYGDVLSLQNLLNTPSCIAQRKALEFELTEDNIISAVVEGVLPASEFARLEGYEDVESFILGYYGGLSESQIAALGDDERKGLIMDNIMAYAHSYEMDGKEYTDSIVYDGVGSYTVEAKADIYEYDDVDMDSLTFLYSWTLTPEEAVELYTECILPDMAEQTIGKVWLIDGESYRRSVYSATISIDARAYSDAQGSDGYVYEYFYTVPTTDSLRTNLWLSAHGVVMMTLAELGLQ